jgi:hypothetical protein
MILDFKQAKIQLSARRRVNYGKKIMAHLTAVFWPLFFGSSAKKYLPLGC